MSAPQPVSARLKALRDRAGLTVRAVAESIGVALSTYASYESDRFKGQHLPMKLVHQLSPLFERHGIDEWEVLELAGVRRGAGHLMHKTPDLPPALSGDLYQGFIEINGMEFASVGRYDAALSAGAGSLIDPNAEPLGYHIIEAQWLRMVSTASPEHMAVVRVDGDSMEATFVDGDWVLIDRTQRRVNREGVYALQVGDIAWIKRLTLNLRERLIRIISDNDRYPMQELPEEELSILGRVVSVVSRKVT